jgi:hypothetical protein
MAYCTSPTARVGSCILPQNLCVTVSRAHWGGQGIHRLHAHWLRPEHEDARRRPSSALAPDGLHLPAVGGIQLIRASWGMGRGHGSAGRAGLAEIVSRRAMCLPPQRRAGSGPRSDPGNGHLSRWSLAMAHHPWPMAHRPWPMAHGSSPCGPRRARVLGEDSNPALLQTPIRASGQ